MSFETFADKRILLTGASGGIGDALARQLAAERARLVLIARRADKLESLATACRAVGAEVHVVAADLSSEAPCRAAVEQAVAALGGLDVLLLNAGITHDVRFEDIPDLAILRTVLDVNYLGPAYCTAAALPQLRQSGGAIVVVSSLQGKTGFPGSSAYCASKHALHGLFDSLRCELDGSGVSVTIVCPGAVDTPIHGTKEKRVRKDASMMSANECARLILRAAKQRRREEVLTPAGKLGMWLRPMFPGLVDRMVRRGIERFYE
jgi:NAD(P)-dependent dehydrogenase (short-subunit alcohol dehydrogenase family)